MHMPPILTLQPLKFVGRGILLGMCQTYQILNIITFIFKQLLAFMSLKEGGPIQIYSWFFTFIKLKLIPYFMKWVFKKYGIDFINGQRQQLQENAFQPGDTQLVKRHTLTLVKHVVCRSLSETSYLDILNCPYRGTRRGVTAPRHPGGVCSVYLLNSGKESSYLSNHMFRTTVLSHHTQFPDLISKLGI